MKFKTIPVTLYEQNCTLIWCEDTNEAAFIDPGGDVDVLLKAAEDEGVTVKMVLLTHGHLDHAGGAAELKRQTGCDIIGPHIGDKFWLDQLESQSAMLGIPGGENIAPDQWLLDGDVVELGSLNLQVIHTPGHTPGHVCYFEESNKALWVGDVIFRGSVGRTDFPQGSFEQLEHSCKELLFPLGENITFYPGHGPSSTLGYEMRHNPFVGEDA